MNSPILTIVSFLIIFTVVVVSHEFGHFLIARLNGIKVVEFTIGMGPALFRKKGKHTEFVLRALPFGGACIFEGEDGNIREAEVDIKDDTAGRNFNDAPVWGRIAAVLAGPVFNIILAYLLSLFMVWFSGADLPVVHSIMEGFPAEEAGLKEGDVITSINHSHVYVWREVVLKSFLNHGESLEIEYERGGEKFVTVLTPKYDEAEGRYYIGFSGGSDYVKCNNLKVFKYSAIEVRYWLVATVDSIKYMFGGHGKLDDLAGPVGVANVIDDTIEQTIPYGAMTVLLNMFNIAVLLSVNLGVINLLPVPALDGGRLLFLIFEAVSGRKIPPEKEGFVHMIGFVLLMILMVVVLFNDITRFFR
ncbi:MAG: RIP metalloprotease RseP [Lachnospiraceae bacterium]|nr:RIP metalloprotease RseP [Lachnospiraceae bacterium]